MAFDFKAKADHLLKRIGGGGEAGVAPQHAVNRALARTAIELALKEAYEQGQAEARAQPVAGTRPAASRPAAAPSRPKAEAPARDPSEDCAHEWEDVFLDGRSLGSKCLQCGILERDLQAKCAHYFVQVGKEEVCVACRKPRRGR